MSTSDNNLSNYNSLNVPNGSSLKIALIVSEWNSEITEKLYEGAFKTLIENGVLKKDIKRYSVPGSYELVYSSKIITSQINSFTDSSIYSMNNDRVFFCKFIEKLISAFNLLVKNRN